jgi:hypothetical protein
VKKKNAGGVLYLMSNPRRKRSRNRSHRRSRSRSRGMYFASRSRKNPGGYRRRRSHRNPNIGPFSATELVKLGVGSAGGFIGARYVTQLILGDSNTGIMGYAATAAVTLGLAWAAAKFAGKDIAAGVAAGGLGGLFARIWSENVSGSAPAAAASSGMSGLGDVDFSASGLGAYIGSGFPVPTVSGGPTGGYLTYPTAGPVLATPAQSSANPGASTVARFASSRLGT